MSDGVEEEVVEKVAEMMEALDHVKRYRAFSALVQDFAMIILSSVAAMWALGLAADFYKVETGLGPMFTPTSVTYVGGQSVLSLLGPIYFVIPIVGLIAGILWVDRGMQRVKTGEWREELKGGFPSAIKLLEGMDWEGVLRDAGISRISYATYLAVKLAAYWALAFLLLFWPYSLLTAYMHVVFNPYMLAVISLAVVLALSWGSLERGYQQLASLDFLIWELRWFSHEFRSGSEKFEA